MTEDTAAKHFTLTLTEKQARVIMRSLELQQRVHMGQLEHCAYELQWNGRIVYAEDTPETRQAKHLTWERHDLLQTMLRALNPLVTEERHPGTSLGIRSERVGDDARVSYDLQQVMRHGLYLADPDPEKPTHTIDADKPYRTSEQEALATMEVKP